MINIDSDTLKVFAQATPFGFFALIMVVVLTRSHKHQLELLKETHEDAVKNIKESYNIAIEALKESKGG